MNTQELREKALRLMHEARAKLSENTAEADIQHDAMMAEADSLEARAAKFEAIEAREAVLNAADPRRPVERDAETRAARVEKTVEERHAEVFAAFIRGQEFAPELRAREFRDQTVGSNSSGGYLVPTTFVAELIRGLKAYGPMMNADACTHLSTASGNPMNWPAMDDTANTGRLVAEAAAINTVSLTFSQKVLGAYKYTSDFFKLSSEFLQDAAVEPGRLVVDALSERLGRILNTHLTTGTGSAQPTGIVTAVGTPALISAGAGAISYDDIVEAIHQVDPAYRNGPKTSFMFSDATLKVIRKLKDSQGHPLWQPDVRIGAPATILGYTYQINQDMAAVATGNVPVLFGDFSKYYVRVSRDVTVKRADERFIDNDETAFVGFARVDGNLMDSRAVKGLKIQ